MNIPSDFFYAVTVKEFLELITKNRIADIIDSMLQRAQESSVFCGDSEIKSWKYNFDAIAQLLSQSDVAGDAVVAFEYKIPVGGRIDCVLFGQGVDKAANMLHIELKQWSNNNVSAHYSGYTFCTDIILDGAKQTKYTSHPSAQAHEYHNHLLNYLYAFEENNIKLHGFAYCYNYLSKDKNAILCENTYDHVTRFCPLYCKDQINEFAQRVHELIGLGKGEEIMEKISNSKIGTTKRLQDAARTMFDGCETRKEFSLVENQLDVYNSILGSICNKDKKTVVIVKGGPGTGKSVVAMRLISDLAKTGNFKNIFYSTRSTSLVKGYTEILKDVSYANGKDCSAIDLLKKNARIKPYYNDECKGESWIDALIVDEAHRIENTSNDMNEKDKRHQTHLSQIMNFLFSSRVSVFFIDDFQSVRKTEIGTAEAIKKAARNYYKNIISENEKYIKGLENSIEKVKAKLDKALLNGDASAISKAKEAIKSLEEKLKVGLEWVKDATPNVKDVEILEFELPYQFRCNGSNNYIDWIERVLYNTPRTQNVKLIRDQYEFEVFDSPTAMYKKVREMDDFGRFADERILKGYSYENILNEAKGEEFKQRARLLAGWCWPWKQDRLEPWKQNGEDLLHEIKITEEDGSLFSIPWETLPNGRKPTGVYKKMYAPNADVWLNDINGINQTGCIHSAQGWEVDYVGVIIAGDIKYDAENDCLCCNEDVKNEDKKIPNKGADRDRLTKNIYRVLMTRGKKGCFVYACDPQVRAYIKRLLVQ